MAAPESANSSAPRRAPVPKRKKPGPYRVPPREQRHGLLIVNTGDGKGKRPPRSAWCCARSGRSMRVGMFQFMKAAASPTAESTGAEPLGRRDCRARRRLHVGRGRHRRRPDAGRRGMGPLPFSHRSRRVRRPRSSTRLTLPLAYGCSIPRPSSKQFARGPIGTHVVITGRRAPAALIDAADLVTDMRVIKHPYREQGVRAQAGIDV